MQDVEDVECVFSINVHEKPDFFQRQMNNIREHVHVSFIVIVNCNKKMHAILQDWTDPAFILNPEPLEKRRAHGSLLHGIYSNMCIAEKKYRFKYFVVLSSRNMFYNHLQNVDQIAELPCNSQILSREQIFALRGRHASWAWPKLRRTLLFKHLCQHDRFTKSAHEGLAMDAATTRSILAYIEALPPEIMVDLFDFKDCVEEFAFQSIAINTTGTFFDIGNGVFTQEDVSKLAPNRLVHKIRR